MTKRTLSIGEQEIISGKRKKTGRLENLDNTDHGFNIVVEDPKDLANLGAIIRSASFFNIGQVCVVVSDDRAKLPESYERYG
jgi:tRNA G18 (ribose-2'-O)-methylase SpoU